MTQYLIECDFCDSRTRVTVRSIKEEPEFCPICGTESYVSIIAEDEDSDG